MSNPTHFTAWLVNNPVCLDQDCMDVTILEDELIGGDPDDHDDWATDTTKEQPFYAVTTVDAESGDLAAAKAEAEQLMAAKGWLIVDDQKWADVPNAYVVPVVRA